MFVDDKPIKRPNMMIISQTQKDVQRETERISLSPFHFHFRPLPFPTAIRVIITSLAFTIPTQRMYDMLVTSPNVNADVETYSRVNGIEDGM